MRQAQGNHSILAFVVVGPGCSAGEIWLVHESAFEASRYCDSSKNEPVQFIPLLRADGARVLEVPSISIRPLWQDSHEFQSLI